MCYKKAISIMVFFMSPRRGSWKLSLFILGWFVLFLSVMIVSQFTVSFCAYAAEPVLINTITHIGGSLGSFSGLGASFSQAAYQFMPDKKYSLSAFETGYSGSQLTWTLRDSLGGTVLGVTHAPIISPSGRKRWEFNSPVIINQDVVYYLQTETGFVDSFMQRMHGSSGNWILANQVYGFRDDISAWVPFANLSPNYVGGVSDVTFFGEVLTKIFVAAVKEVDPSTGNFLHEGATVSRDSVGFQAAASTTPGVSVKLQAEARKYGEPFTENFDNGIYESELVASPGTVSVTVPSLSYGDYHARLRVVDDLGNASDWQEFGAAGNVDFTVNLVAGTTSTLINTFNQNGGVVGNFDGLGTSFSAAAYPFMPDKDYTLTRFEMDYLGPDGLYWNIRTGLDGEILATSTVAVAVPNTRKKWEFFGGVNLKQGETYYLVTAGNFYSNFLYRALGSGTAWGLGSNTYGLIAHNNLWNTFFTVPQNLLVGTGNGASVDFYGFMAVSMKTPVIIVPGIMGSQLYQGNNLYWLDINRMLLDINDNFLNYIDLDLNGNSVNPVNVGDAIEAIKFPNDPAPPQLQLKIDTFESLRIKLQEKGYSWNQDLFFFPYDWRLNLDITKDLLNQKIEQIKTETGASKVDIVAHSMGGLLVKDYINQYGKGSLDKLIFVGTPHLGAPKSARTLLEGDNFGIPWLDNDAIKEVAHNSPAVYELLPSQAYFNNLSGYIKPWSFLLGSNVYNYSETNDFLLNQGMNATVLGQAWNFFSKNLQNTDFSGTDTYNIVGCDIGTESIYRLHVLNNNIGLIGYSTGDGTVPFGSADFINLPTSKKYYVKKANHSSLPSVQDVRQGIVNILSDSPVATSSNFQADSSLCGIKGKVLTWHSPVEVQIYDAQDRHTGPIENNAVEYGIPDVQYQIFGHEKFIFLPTESGQTYRIEGQGNAQGTFDLLIAQNNNGVITSTNVFNDVSVSTSTAITFSVSSISQDNAITIQEGDSASSVIQVTSVLPGNQGEDVVAPVTVATSSGPMGLNGWYTGDVKVVLQAADDNSGILETRYSINNETASLPYTLPITISKEGTSTIRYFSIDKAGNNEEVKSFMVKINTLPARAYVWLGLKNSDDVGIKFDIRAELYKKNTSVENLVEFGELKSVPGGSSGFNNAHQYTITMSISSSTTFMTGDSMYLKVLVRNACSGSGKNSGVARLWLGDSSANSRASITIQDPQTYYLYSGGILSLSRGSNRSYLDIQAGAKCSIYKSIGIWNYKF